MAEMLLSHGAELNVRDRHGWMPLQLAQAYDNDTVCRMLQPTDRSEDSFCSEDGYPPQCMINATEHLDYAMDEKGVVTVAGNCLPPQFFTSTLD